MFFIYFKSHEDSNHLEKEEMACTLMDCRKFYFIDCVNATYLMQQYTNDKCVLIIVLVTD